MPSFALRKYLPAILWAVLIMIICGVPGNEIPKVYLFSFDKLGHSIIFLIFFLLLLFALRSPAGEFTLPNYFTATAIAMVYAALTEILQAYVFINRVGDIRDFIADALGIIAGLVIFPLIQKRMFGKNRY